MRGDDRAYANCPSPPPGPDRSEGVIPSTRSRKAPIPLAPLIYKLRDRVERYFCKLKHFRRFATRFDRLARHYLAVVHIAASMLWVR